MTWLEKFGFWLLVGYGAMRISMDLMGIFS